MKTKFIQLSGTLLFVLLLANTSCSKESPGPNQVWMQNTAYNPSSITVAVNTTVTWTNKDNQQHSVTSDSSGLFDSGVLNPGGTFARQFTTAGTYKYHCTVHNTMFGTVIVQ